MGRHLFLGSGIFKRQDLELMKYTARMKHTADTITKLVLMQYNTFQVAKKVIRIVIAVGLIVYGVMSFSSGMITPLIAFFFGSVLISGTDVRAKYNAKKIIKQMNGRFPSSEYTFTETGFKDAEKSAEIPYGKLIKLIDDKEYLYLYISTQSAYMVDSSTVTGKNGLEGLKELVSDKANLQWVSPVTFFNFNIYSFRDKTKRKKDKDRGPRIGDRRLY